MRVAAGLTQEEAAERIGLDPRHLQKLERGEANATLGTLLRVADGLGVSPTILVLVGPPKARASRRSTTVDEGAAYLPNPPPTATTDDATRRALGKAVARFRRAGAMTQVDLAARAGVSAQFIQAVEAGKRNLTLRSVVRLANALRVSPHDLFRLGAEDSPARDER